jgi:dipeptidyl aminopeptidase/acylaminoacyl peptidase
MRLLASSLAFSVSLVLVACGAEAPPPAAPVAPPPPAAAPADSSATAPPAPVVDSNPTERTADQKARDDARLPLANALMDAFTNYGPELSHDKKRVLFASRRDGNREYYLGDVAKPDGAPVAITHGPERASGARFSRDGKSIFFMRDTGADENYRIYQVGLDGKNETCLTPGAVLHRDAPNEPRGMPGVLVYTQHDVKSAASDLVVQKVGGGPKVVYTDTAPAFLSDVTRDGKRALVVRWNSASDFVLFEVDLATAKTHRLYPEEGKKVVVNDASYSPDGARVFVAGDDGGAAQLLFALDARTGAVKQKFVQASPATASIGQVVVSPRGDELGIGVDAGDHREAWLFDAKTLTPNKKVQAPLGDVTFSSFSDDGTKIGLTISQPAAPMDVFSVDVATGAVTPLRSDARPGLDKLQAIDSSVEMVKAFDGLTLPVITYLPAGAKASGKKLPVIAEFHGGPSASSTVDWDVFARFFVAQGYAFLEPNVRGSTGYGRAYEMADNREKRADWLKDLASVNDWVKSQPWADPNRVIVMGGSYGGYTVLMALTRQPTAWRAGVDYVGVANLFTFLKSTDQAIRSGFVDEFGDLDKDQALLTQFSPLGKVDQIVAPLYVYQGQNDPRVPRPEADQIVKALRAKSVPVEYQVAPNEGHSLDHRENRAEFLVRVARFLEDNVK